MTNTSASIFHPIADSSSSLYLKTKTKHCLQKVSELPWYLDYTVVTMVTMVAMVMSQNDIPNDIPVFNEHSRNRQHNQDFKKSETLSVVNTKYSLYVIGWKNFNLHLSVTIDKFITISRSSDLVVDNCFCFWKKIILWKRFWFTGKPM